VNLTERHVSLGAALANDGVPLHYGDQAREYRAALSAAVLMERSHEGRLLLTGRDRLAIMHRISTNDLQSLPPGEGQPTIFTTPTARVIDRATVYALPGERVFVVTEPGRGEALKQYLQRNVFFNDELRISDASSERRQFTLHGAAADQVIAAAYPDAATLPVLGSLERDGMIIARDKPLTGSHWRLFPLTDAAPGVWDHLLNAGAAHGLIPAGSLTYNALRIRAGRPGVGRELTGDYIPLELGLWDEVSFKKGCYTGQEIIARMESRGRLAKTIAALRLDAPVTAPAPLLHDEREAGMLTSSVTTPDGEHLGIGVIKLALAEVGQQFTANGVNAAITGLPGAQPPL
jgi:folate-binding protein YgfZ